MKKLTKLLMLVFLSCGEGKTVVEQPPIDREPEPEPIERVQCGSFDAGETRTKQCPSGQRGSIIEVCSASGWNQLSNTCSRPIGACEEDAKNKITFDKHIKPIMQRECISCHSVPENYGDYEVVKRLMQPPNYDILDRIRRDDARRMPKIPREPLGAEDRDLFERWLADGLLKNVECAEEDQFGNSFKFQTLDDAEILVERDLNLLDSDTRQDTRYLFINHRYNQKLPKGDQQQHIDGIMKFLNSISLEEEIIRPVALDARKTVYRLNLEDFGLDESPRFGFVRPTPEQLIWSVMAVQIGPPDFANALFKARRSRNFWDLVLAFEPFKFESFTTRGINIKNLTGSPIPWLHADNFGFTAGKEDALYYAAINAPATFNELTQDLGVDYQELFDEFDTILAGGFGSPITLNKNRLIQRFESRRSALGRNNSPVWVTFDPDDRLVEGDEAANLFEFPLLAQTGSRRVFSFAAGEVIFMLPNGFLGYFLNNAAGDREGEAPINIVTAALEDPFNPAIEVMISCGRCHHQRGIIPMNDQVRNQVRNNPIFDREDINLVEALYPDATSLNATFQSDYNQYKAVMDEAGIDLNKGDPYVYSTDQHRRDWKLGDFCGFIFLPESECRACISESAVLLAQIGQLLEPNGSTSLAQIQQSFGDVIRECEINQEDIDQ